MTAYNYVKTAATASRLLTRFGAACTLKRQTSGAYDTSTALAVVTETSLAAVACVFDYAQSYIDGTLILAGDKQAFMASSPVPKQGDRFTWAAIDYTVQQVKPISPAGVPVLYECQVRG